MRSSSHRQQAILQARDLLDCHPLFLDTETTGLGDRAEIVEICIVENDGSVAFESLVKPKGRIPPDVIGIHGITDKMVQDQPFWPEVWPEVARTLHGRHVAIFNSDFDLRMLRQSHALHGLPWDLGTDSFFCLMKLYARFRGEWSTIHRDYRWHSLETAARRCRIEIDGLHRARTDALLAREVLLYLAHQPC